MKTSAYISGDRRYRYWLLREWDASLPILAVFGVNPSTADENTDDPTIRKVKGFAARLGFGAILMLNVGAYRSTDPREWAKSTDPFGPENTVDHLREYIAQNSLCSTPGELPTKGVTTIVAAWGRNGIRTYHSTRRCLEILKAFPNIMCWGKNPDKTPRHPLMLAYSTQLEPYQVSAPPDSEARKGR